MLHSKEAVMLLLFFTIIHADVAELADALDLGSSTSVCRFDSCHPHFLFRDKEFK